MEGSDLINDRSEAFLVFYFFFFLFKGFLDLALMGEVTPVPILTDFLLQEGIALFGFVKGIIAIIAFQLLDPMSELTLQTIRAKTCFFIVFAEGTFVLGMYI